MANTKTQTLEALAGGIWPIEPDGRIVGRFGYITDSSSPRRLMVVVYDQAMYNRLRKARIVESAKNDGMLFWESDIDRVARIIGVPRLRAGKKRGK